ncbi:MAG: hypothetical protein K8R99_04090 [Actinomycetia bacterium]|nr:hypothetical protein [Actinomycetes bacterium]
MRKQTGDVELIQVFAPDDAALWTGAEAASSEPFNASTGQPLSYRRFALASAVALLAAIVGVIALGDDENSNSAASTTTLAVPTTLRSLLDPTPNASPTTHYLIDDPSLTPYSADIVTPPADGEQVQVWTNGLPVGPIVIIALHPHSFESYGIVGASRDLVDGIEIVRPTAQPDTAISEFAVDDNWSVAVRATRLEDSEVAQIVHSIQVVDGELADGSAVMDALGLGRTFEAESLDDLIFGRVESSVRYLTADGEVATLRSATGISANRLAGVRYLAIDAQMFFYDSMYGRLADTGDIIVVWEEEGRLLSFVAPGELDEVIRLRGAVRAATEQEWSSMLYGLRPDYTLGDFETLATGFTTSGEFWAAGPQIAERAGRTEFLWWWTVPGRRNVTDSTATSTGVGSRPQVDTLVVPGGMFVFVTQPGEGGTVTVRTATGVELTAELAQPFAESEVFMAVVRVEEPGLVTVAINGLEVAV